MHLLGKSMEVTATTPDGETIPLIRISDWDFRWQGQYLYTQPLRLPAGTRLDLVAVYDNSAANPDNPNRPPARVRNGEETEDEMCLAFFQIYLDDDRDFAKLRFAVRPHDVRLAGRAPPAPTWNGSKRGRASTGIDEPRPELFSERAVSPSANGSWIGEGGTGRGEEPPTSVRPPPQATQSEIEPWTQHHHPGTARPLSTSQRLRFST